MSAPLTADWNGRELTLWTFGQLDSMSRMNVKQRALNLQDLIGADQLPPLSTGQREATIKWILEVQVLVCGSKGMNVRSIEDFGWVGNDDERAYFDPGPPMSQAAPPPGYGSTPQGMMPPQGRPNDAHSEAMAGAAAARQRNQGSYVFGDGSTHNGPHGGRQTQAQAQMSAHEDAMAGAHAARQRNQGSNIFG